jgi:hypothetical protein
VNATARPAARDPGLQRFFFQRFGHFMFNNNNPSMNESKVMIAAIRMDQPIIMRRSPPIGGPKCGDGSQFP